MQKSSQNQPRLRAVCLDVEYLSPGLSVNNPDHKDLLLQKYIELIEKYCAPPTDLVLLPEKITKLQSAEASKYYNIFANLANRKNCLIIAGWTSQGKYDRNMAAVFFLTASLFWNIKRSTWSGVGRGLSARGNML